MGVPRGRLQVQRRVGPSGREGWEKGGPRDLLRAAGFGPAASARGRLPPAPGGAGSISSVR
eukprot:6337337-Pyramimonas_sp.AAC.1